MRLPEFTTYPRGISPYMWRTEKVHHRSRSALQVIRKNMSLDSPKKPMTRPDHEDAFAHEQEGLHKGLGARQLQIVWPHFLQTLR